MPPTSPAIYSRKARKSPDFDTWVGSKEKNLRFGNISPSEQVFPCEDAGAPTSKPSTEAVRSGVNRAASFFLPLPISRRIPSPFVLVHPPEESLPGPIVPCASSLTAASIIPTPARPAYEIPVTHSGGPPASIPCVAMEPRVAVTPHRFTTAFHKIIDRKYERYNEESDR